MSKRYWLEIYGCQMNFAEGYALENELEKRGWETAERPEEADVAVLHTCSVRQTAENRIWGRIGFFKHLKQSRAQKLVVMGCMAERLKEDIRKGEPAVDMVVGNFAKNKLAEMLTELEEGTAGEGTAGNAKREFDYFEEGPLEFQEDHLHGGDFHAYVPIMHGCDNFCTYCIVPYVRGREVSRAPEKIIEEIHHLEQRGVREISLLGQNVNSYFYTDPDGNGQGSLNFPALLKLVLKETDSLEWIRFITSHPKDVDPELIDLIAGEERLCSHLHLPVQHGSSTVLKRMNRKYSREDYEKLVAAMRSSIRDLSLTTDIMIGFPGETEKDFKETLELMEEIRFDDAFMYYFNPREGTPAAAFDDQIPKSLKLERLAELIEVQKKISREKRLERIGRIEKVLAESVSKKNRKELLGRTERDKSVVFPAPVEGIGKFFHIKLEGLNGNTYRGSVQA
jgi:tRNA-2-methylthio-N6-dimethylallyladenosine synthase